MKDPRLRLIAVTLLSLASFINPLAALATLGWWGVHETHRREVLSSSIFLFYALLIGGLGVLIQETGGDGVSYGVRILAIVLIASWAYRQHRSGEFMDVSAWALGTGTGFELGLVAEMSLQGLRQLGEDVEQARMARRLKNDTRSWRVLLSLPPLLLHHMLTRSDQQAQLLAVRGYRQGGTVCPRFSRGRSDRIGLTLAGLVLLIAILASITGYSLPPVP